MSEPSTSADTPRILVIEPLVRWYFLASLCFLSIALLAGLLVALQLVNHNPLSGIEWFSPGRWRMVHVAVIGYGFLANAMWGTLHWVIPRLALRPVSNNTFSWCLFGAWQAIVLATIAGLVLGQAQGIKWGETPIWIDPLVLLVFILVAINFLVPIFQTAGPGYVSVWYFTAMLVWTPLAYAMGNFLPQFFVGGVGGGAIGGLFLHDMMSLFITPFAWGMMYYFVPIILKKPIWSHGLALVGFWGLAFFAPLAGIQYFLYTPIPLFLQYGAVFSAIGVELALLTAIINFLGTFWNRGDDILRSIPLRWYFTGTIFYLIACILHAVETTLTFQAILQFTDTTVARAHLVLFGVFGFWIFGTMTHLFPRLLGREWASERLCEHHYWFSMLGLAIMFFDLALVGVLQGFSWSSLQPWDASVQLSIPYWWIRTIAGLGIFAGQICFFVNIYKTYRLPLPAEKPTDVTAPE